MSVTKINIEGLKERTADDYDLMRDLVALLQVEKLNYENCIFESLNKSDYEGIASVAHKMKSAVAVLGFDFLAGRIADVEKNALKKTSDFDYTNEISSIFISLSEHINELENYLKQ